MNKVVFGIPLYHRSDSIPHSPVFEGRCWILGASSPQAQAQTDGVSTATTWAANVVKAGCIRQPLGARGFWIGLGMFASASCAFCVHSD